MLGVPEMGTGLKLAYVRDDLPVFGFAEHDTPARRWVSVIQQGQDVIDLCSGDGWFTLPIAKIANHVVAVDLDPALLEVARNTLAK